uniref:Variable lymphocyte receptor B cassette n=1 Tax=Petromyzon marinus TaxID=7757 RepID=S4RNG1_PETMA
GHVVDCENRHLSSVPAEIPTNTEFLFLYNNQLKAALTPELWCS